MCHSNCGYGKGHCTLCMVGKILVIVGGVNWGLVGVGMFMGSDFNVVRLVLGSVPVAESVVYVLVGLAAVLEVFGGCKCKKCKEACASCDVHGSMGEKMGGNM